MLFSHGKIPILLELSWILLMVLKTSRIRERISTISEQGMMFESSQERWVNCAAVIYRSDTGDCCPYSLFIGGVNIEAAVFWQAFSYRWQMYNPQPHSFKKAGIMDELRMGNSDAMIWREERVDKERWWGDWCRGDGTAWPTQKSPSSSKGGKSAGSQLWMRWRISWCCGDRTVYTGSRVKTKRPVLTFFPFKSM